MAETTSREILVKRCSGTKVHASYDPGTRDSYCGVGTNAAGWGRPSYYLAPNTPENRQRYAKHLCNKCYPMGAK